MPSVPSEHGAAAAVFRTTQWSMVLAAGSANDAQSMAALEGLCRRYWYPLYAWVRRSGYSHEDAADMTQSFFARVVEKKIFTGVEPGMARFRSFLLTALKHFMINEWQRANRLKRGGGKEIISLDEKADDVYRAEPSHAISPDKLFEKQWALTIVEAALGKLRAEFAAAEKPGLFDALKPALTGEKLDKGYAEVAAEFGLSENALRVAVHRMRKRFGEVLRAEVVETIRDPAEVDDEVRYLIQALS